MYVIQKSVARKIALIRSGKVKRLYVLYKPGLETIEHDSAIVSFMSPDDEYGVSLRFPKLLFGRKEMDAVRDDTRAKYVDLVSRIASTPCNGKTLRQILNIPDRGNPWWYHAVSEKQVEGDGIYNVLLQIFTIINIAQRENIREIVLYGSGDEVIDVLKTRFKVTGVRSSFKNRKDNLFRAVLSRIMYLVNSLISYYAIQRYAVLTQAKFDVALQGFWDWSVRIDRKTGRIDDKYFKSLPDRFSMRGVECGWLLWLDTRSKKGWSQRSVCDMLCMASKNPKLIFAQKFLKMSDIFSAIFDMRFFYRYRQFMRSENFRQIFNMAGCDVWPVFRRKLSYGFCDSSIPHHILMEIAYRRTFAYLKPKMSFAFLELFRASRAFNKAAMLGSPATIRCDMQHASYARDKTFILTDREKELCGKPDEIAMPVPDNYFVMGELSKDILAEDGFPADKIFITGSARFDHMKESRNRPYADKNPSPAKVLIVATLNVNFDLEMVKAASIACQGLAIKLYLRSHPLVKIEDLPAYKGYSNNIISSKATLEEDLSFADLILFTYSTVAEEAFLRGIPVLRWQANGFSGSVFNDIDVAPKAYSVSTLKDAFKGFLDNPASFKPNEKDKNSVLYKCFYRTDGMAADRIAEKSAELLSGN